MKRNYFYWIILLTLACIVFVFIFIWNATVTDIPPAYDSTIQPSLPFSSYISAVGVVEASGGNILIGSPTNRLVDRIEVTANQKVKKGDILFQLESNDLQAELASRWIDYEQAQANLKKLEALPRDEDLISASAQVKTAKAEFEQATNQYERVNGLQHNGAMSAEEIARRQFTLEKAEAGVQQAQAHLDKTKGGTWPPDLEIARLQVKQAQAAVQRVTTAIERNTIRSPADATILQLKIHEGELPPTDPARNPSMIIGNTETLHLRVSIDQFESASFNPNMPAIAYLQGNSSISFPLKFVNVEPYFTTKQNITNEITERLDTRVLQTIYSFEQGENRVFVGQQLDVFIETKE